MTIPAEARKIPAAGKDCATMTTNAGPRMLPTEAAVVLSPDDLPSVLRGRDIQNGCREGRVKEGIPQACNHKRKRDANGVAKERQSEELRREENEPKCDHGLAAMKITQTAKSDFAEHDRTAAALVGVFAGALVAQTKIVPPKNKYTPEQDGKLGKEAAAEVEKQLPIIRDDMFASYLERVGQRLVDASPDALNNPVFEYSFTPVDLKDINAFRCRAGPCSSTAG